jgi:SAM-dependent methyltransferase
LTAEGAGHVPPGCGAAELVARRRRQSRHRRREHGYRLFSVEGRAAYDRIADWYDDYVRHTAASFTAEVARLVRELVGPGSGTLLDLGCGSGAFIPVAGELGWSVVGVDISTEQIRIARERVGAEALELVEADATQLPFGDETFDAVLTVLTSTDVEPWEGLVAEAARVLRPGGALVHVGLHPCFVGPHAVTRDGVLTIDEGYRERSRQFDLPAFKPDGVRARVGATHVPLEDLLDAVIQSELELERIVERPEQDTPLLLALRARRPRP